MWRGRMLGLFGEPGGKVRKLLERSGRGGFCVGVYLNCYFAYHLCRCSLEDLGCVLQMVPFLCR